MIVVIIRDGKELSLKTRFIAQLFRLSANCTFLHVTRKEEDKFNEKWHGNEIELATSTLGILVYFILMILKPPKDLHDGIIRRLSRKKPAYLIRVGGFLSVLSQALYQYFGRSARTEGIMRFLKKLTSPKLLLIDEFFSLNSFNLKMLKDLGPIVYVSSDFAYDFYADNFAASKLMYKKERIAIPMMDLIIACSERDKLKYIEMGARKVVFYPNIYPIPEFEPSDKDPVISISIVLREHWSSRADKSLQEIFKALSLVDRKIKVYMIGREPEEVPKNVELQYHDYLPNKLDFLKALSKSWIGINMGIHMGGTNQRKYDYAMAGLVVFSDTLGVRGDLLPYEFTFVDCHDLAAKLRQLLKLGKEKIIEMGMENRKQALALAEERREKLLRMAKEMEPHGR